ncbi:MAG: isoprenylcysteine carboxylmethyltransferase family protein [Spirosomataceae bacterium]
MKSNIKPDGYFLLLLSLSVLFHFVFPILQIIPQPYSYFGIVFLVTGFIVVYISNKILTEQKTSIQPFETPDKLVSNGTFRYSRNPIYLGMTLALLGISVLLGSLTAFLPTSIFWGIMNFKIIPSEEKILEKTFGNSFTAYKSNVRRWI